MVYQHILALSRLDRLRGAVLLFWPTWAALMICTQGHVPVFEGILFTLGVILTRSLGCVINDIADIKFDYFVQRTSKRPLVAGTLSVTQAWGLFLIFLGLAFICWLYLEPQAQLAALASLLLAIIYPWTKRFFFALSWY